MDILSALKEVPNEVKMGHVKIPSTLTRMDTVFDMATEEGRLLFWKSIQSENIKELNLDSSKIVISLIPSSHTNGTMSHPSKYDGTRVKAHMLVWNKNLTTDISPRGLDFESTYRIANAITEAVKYEKSDTSEMPVFYSLVGFGSKNDSLGFSPAVQSNPYVHWHVNYPPAPSSNKIPLTPLEKIKFYSPVSQVFKDEFINLAKSISPGEINAFRSEGHNPIETNIYFQLPNSNRLTDYLSETYKLVGGLNYIYKAVLSNYEKKYLSNRDQYSVIDINTCFELDKLGINDGITKPSLDHELIRRLLVKSESFKPTLRQINNWLLRDNLSDEVRSRLNETKSKYLKLKTRIGVLPNDLEKLILHDQLLDSDEGQPFLTVPRNIPLKIVCTDYGLRKTGKISVTGFDISLLLLGLGGNTAENLGSPGGGGVIIDRT